MPLGEPLRRLLTLEGVALFACHLLSLWRWTRPHIHIFCVTVIDGLYFFIITWTLVVFILAKCLVLICVFWGREWTCWFCSKTWVGVGVGGSLLCCKDLILGYSVFYEIYLDPMPEIWKHMYKNHFYVLFLINHCVWPYMSNIFFLGSIPHRFKGYYLKIFRVNS